MFKMSASSLEACWETMKLVMNDCHNDSLLDSTWSTSLLLSILGCPDILCIFVHLTVLLWLSADCFSCWSTQVAILEKGNDYSNIVVLMTLSKLTQSQMFALASKYTIVQRLSGSFNSIKRSMFLVHLIRRFCDFMFLLICQAVPFLVRCRFYL